MAIWDWLFENWLYLVLGGYAVFLIFRSNWFWQSRGRDYLAAWRTFAEHTKTLFTPGSFSPRAAVKPRINGTYQGREIEIIADTRGKWGFNDSVLRISISVKNKETNELPVGAFFVVGDPVKRTFISRLVGSKGSDEIDAANFPMKSVPQNLGNHLLSQKSAQALLLLPKTNDILIERQRLVYRQAGLERDDQVMMDLLIKLYVLADSFEHFSRNWIS